MMNFKTEYTKINSHHILQKNKMLPEIYVQIYLYNLEQNCLSISYYLKKISLADSHKKQIIIKINKKNRTNNV